MKKRILIADDDRDFVEVLRERLESVGYETICAYEGIRAIQLANKEQPDAIILDWKMPAGQGSDVLKGLKERSVTRHIPVLVVTGVDDPDIEEKAVRLGAAGYLRKPYDGKVLLQKLREILEMRALEESLGT